MRRQPELVPVLFAVAFALIELVFVWLTDTWLSATDWVLLFLLLTGLSLGLLSTTQLGGLVFNRLSSDGKRLFEMFYTLGCVYVVTWMTGFYIMPVFGRSVLPASEPKPGQYTGEFIALSVACLLIAILVTWFVRRSPRFERVLRAGLPFLWALMLFIVIYDAARTSFQLVHFAALIPFYISVARLLPDGSRRFQWASVGVGLCVIGTLPFLSHRVAHTMAERTRVSFHFQHLVSPLRALPPKPSLECVGRQDVEIPGLPEVRGVLVIFIDAMRADRIGMSYRGKELTPNLTEFGANAKHFTSAYSPYPSTTGTATSLGSGRYEFTDGTALGSILKANQIPFEGIVAHPYVSNPLGDHFQTIELGIPNYNHWFDLTSELITDKVLARLPALDGRFVFLAHYYDAHENYVPNDFVDFGRSMTSRYNAEVALVDHEIGRLLRGLPEDIAVLMFSDHGDELGEHGFFHHQVRVYDGTARVVMMLGYPGVSGRRYDELVSTVDLAPTILTLLGLGYPDDMDGMVLGSAPADRRVMVRGIERFAIVGRDYKVIWNDASATMEVYDRRLDPLESKNLADQMMPDLCNTLVQE